MTEQPDSDTSDSQRMDSRLRQAPIGVIETTTAGKIVEINDTAATLLDLKRSTVHDTEITDSFPKSAAGTLREAFDGTSPTPTSFEEYYPLLDRWLAVDIHVDTGTIVYIRDRTHQQETQETIDQLQHQLNRVQRINSLVSTVLQQVIGASDRSDIAQTVCERLGGTELYRFAWVGDRQFDTERLQMLAAAGDAPTLCERIEESLEDENPLPSQTVVTVGETQLVEAVAQDDAVSRSVRRAAFGHGLQSCLAVPLAYQGTVYGVVTVYSAAEDGFSEQEQAALETLGSIAGFAIKSGRQEDLLVDDTITEVTVAVRDETLPFVGLGRDCDCTLRLDGAVPRGDGAVVCYLTTDSPLEGIVESLTENEAVTDIRQIRSETTPLLQATVVAETPVTALASWGATIRGGEYGSASARFIAEVPSDGDVRRLIETVNDVAEKTRLVAKEERTQTPEPVEAFQDDLSERLTDRQQTVLQTAHLSDYFTSPRGSSSEEVAESLDIAGSTLLYHLRRAEQKLVEAFFSAGPSTGGADSTAETTDFESNVADER